MPEFIERDGDPIAQPCFRILFYGDGSLNDAANARGVTRLFDLFVEHYGAEAAWIAIGDHQRKLRPEPFDAARIEDARTWLNTPNKNWPATCRVVGPISDHTHNVVVPTFRVDEYRVLFLDMSVPDDLERAVPFADRVTEVVEEMPVIAAIMGLGFYLPVALESLATYLPRAFERYRTAIEFCVDGGTMGIRKTQEGFAWDEHLEPGIPDIGWRTIIGAEFLERLPELETVNEKDRVTVVRHESTATLTAGAHPVWGDVERDEDISAYRAVAAALAPVAYPLEVAYGSLFGNQYYELDERKRIEAYLNRFR